MIKNSSTGLFLAFILLGCNFFVQVPKMEIDENIAKMVEFSKCEMDGIDLTCILTNKTTTDEISINSFAAILYDKEGVRIGVQNFPEQNILAGEKIKSRIFQTGPNDVGNVAKMKVTWR